MTSDELLAALQKNGLVDQALANRLRRDSLVSGESLEDVIAKTRSVDDTKIAEINSGLLNIPYQKLTPAGIDEKLFSSIPEETARTYAAVPLMRQDNLLVVGM